MVVSLHPGIGHEMEQMQFNALDIVVCYTTADILHHHLMRLPRKTVD